MKFKKKILLLGIVATSLVVSEIAVLSATKPTERKQDFVVYGLEIPDEDSQYLGYGYDVTSGKAISDPDALLLANPILDVTNPELIKYEKAFSASQTTYLSYSSKSSSEIARQYGMTLGGGVSGKIQMVTLNISTRFNTNTSSNVKFEEEYSYYSIYAKNRTVVLQAGADTLTNYLSDQFKTSALKIDSEESANNFYSKFGTHLVTGYNLGGIFEMTNYYASSSSSYVRQNSLSFSSQVEAAFGAYGAGVDFSFSNNYGSMDNNAYAVNNYKCTTYGGYTFPGLTIDQAFSYYETAFGAGYIYGLWTDSINAGKNLSIVSVPQSSKMIPLFDLLPNTKDYTAARDWLVKSYIKKCGLSYREFLEKYPDVNSNREPSTLSPQDIGYQGLGYEVFENSGTSRFNSYYVSSDDYSDTITVPLDSTLAFDFTQETYFGRNLKWSSNENPNLVLSDERNGIFSIPHDAECGDYLVTLELDTVEIYRIIVRVETSKYYSGLGSDASPYIIHSTLDFMNLLKSKEDWDKAFKLETDIDLLAKEIEQLGYISENGRNPFCGTFDGNYHTISNFYIAKPEEPDPEDPEETLFRHSSFAYGLFGYNTGLVKNLTINDAVIKTFTKETTLLSEAKAECDEKVRVVGGLCGLNEGDISNCYVDDVRIEALTKVEDDHFAVGGVVGQSQGEGTVELCYVSNCYIRAWSKVPNTTTIGGVVGYSNSKADLSYCATVDTIITTTNENSNGNIYSGLICGYTRNNISDCLVHQSANKECSLTIDLPYSTGNAAAAAIVGCVDKDEIKLSRCFVVNVKNITITRKTTSLTPSFMIGVRSTVTKTINYSDCYAEQDSMGTIYATLSNATADGIKILSRLRWGNVYEIIEDDSHWERVEQGNYIKLVLEDLSAGEVSFDFSKAKKIFYVTNGIGEAFQTGEISITASSSSGEETQITNFEIDASSYINNKDSEPGNTYDIRVYAAGKEAKYQVRTVPVSVIGIRVKEKSAVAVDYYEGDTFNPNGLIVNPVYQTGIDENTGIKYKYDPTITSIELANRDYFEIENADQQLVAGLNVFTINYYNSSTKETFSASYSVYAKKSTVSSVTVVPPQSEEGFRLPVGTRTVAATDLVGLEICVNLEAVNDVDAVIVPTDVNNPHSFKIKFDSETLMRNKLLVEYDDPNINSHEIDANEVEFIAPTIKYGDNVVRVCYNGYLLDDSSSFIVKGSYADFEDEFEEFSSIINEYKATDKLSVRFASLKRALELKGILASLEGDDNFIVLCQTLEGMINQYNQDAGRINEININVSKTSMAFYSNGVINNGVVALHLLVGLLIVLL